MTSAPGAAADPQNVRVAIIRLRASGLDLEPHDFFGVTLHRDGQHVAPDTLPEALRESFECLRDDMLEGPERFTDANEVREAVTKLGGSDELADSIAEVHSALAERNLPGFCEEDIEIFCSDDQEHIEGYLDDIEARLGVNVDKAKAQLLEGPPAP